MAVSSLGVVYRLTQLTVTPQLSAVNKVHYMNWCSFFTLTVLWKLDNDEYKNLRYELTGNNFTPYYLP